MALQIISADQRLAEAQGKTTIALFGPYGIGKTSLLYTLPTETTLCLDLEAGMKAVQSWPGESSRIRSFADALDIACLIGGVDPAADSQSFFSEGHYGHVQQIYADLIDTIASKQIIFVDSITDLTRQGLAWARSTKRVLRKAGISPRAYCAPSSIALLASTRPT